MSGNRTNISSGSPWEDIVGFSRTVRVGNQIAVSGTMATDEQGKPMGSSAYEQASVCLDKIRTAIEQAGGSITDVYRTRIYLTDIAYQEEVSRAHREVFGEVKPAATMLVVSSLVAEGFFVEMEADALVQVGI